MRERVLREIGEIYKGDVYFGEDLMEIPFTSPGGSQARHSEDVRMNPKVSWSGVFPAVTTQFTDDFKVDYAATHRVISQLVKDGVSGLIVCGTVGENCSLTRAEKIGVMEAARDAAGGRVPVIAGIAEYTTDFACETAREAQRVKMDGIMVMPALVYSAKPRETAAHFRGVSKATDLPIMVYNNPPIYRNDVTPDILATLADCDTIVCFKESSGDTRRFSDVRNLVGDRFVMFAGLDDVVVESVLVGAVGWVSGMSNAFPREGETLFRLARASASRNCGRSTTGSCRSCTSTRGPISSSASSFASTSPAAART